MARKKYLKIVEHQGKKMVATIHLAVDRSRAKELDDLQWVIPHDHQEALMKEYEEQEKEKAKNA